MEKEIWQMALERLGDDITPATITWLRQARLIPTQTPHSFILQVPSSAAKRQVSQRFMAAVVRAVADVLGVKQVSITVAKGASKHSATITVVEERATLFAQEEAPALAEPEPVAAPVAATPALAEALPVRAARMANDTRYPRDRRNGRPFTPPAPKSSPPPAVQKPTASPKPGIPVKPNVPPPVSKTPSVPATTAKPSAPAVPTISLAPAHEDEFALDTSEWINERYTFDNFIVGGGNQFAFAACHAVADSPGRSYNPLFLYGGVGLGKTHLMHAIAHAVRPRGARTLYITSETFTNEIVNAIRYRTTEEFRAKYRSVDVLLVDDVQFIAGKDSTEEEFFHTFNALHESQKQIVMCSDRPPKEIDLAERLRSRFEWGLIADIKPPDLETRLAILRVKAEGSDIPISDPVMEFLAEKVTTNVRVLEGLLTRVIAFARIQRQPATVEMARQAIMSIAPAERPRKTVSIREILVAVSTFYKISLDDLRGKQRDKHIVMPRQVAMWLMRNDTEASLMEVGQELGGRDHSTVMHGCDKIEQELKDEDSPLIQEIEAIRQLMAG